MALFRPTSRGLLAALALIGLQAPARSIETDSTPRYDWKPGQEFHYSGTSDFKYENGSYGYKTDWLVWVVRKNDDGSSRIVLRSSQTFTRSSGGQAGSEQPAQVTMAYCDVFPDGRIVPNETLGYHLDPTSIIPRLPNDDEQAGKGSASNGGGVPSRTWSGTGDDSHTVYTPAKESAANAGSWVFEGVRETPMDKIYVSTSRSKFFFDTKRGAIGRVESESSQGYGINGKGTGTTELLSVREQDAGSTKTFAEEASRYFAANKANEEILSRAGKDAQHVVRTASRGGDNPERRPRRSSASRSCESKSTSSSRAIRGWRPTTPRRRRTARGAGARRRRMGDQRPGRQAALAQGLPRQSRHPRLLVSRLRLVHPGHAADQGARQRFQGPAGRRPRHEHRPEGRDAKFVVDAMKLELPVAQGRGNPGEVPGAGLPDADHHRPGGQCRRHPRRLLADAPGRGGEDREGAARQEMRAAESAATRGPRPTQCACCRRSRRAHDRRERH